MARPSYVLVWLLNGLFNAVVLRLQTAADAHWYWIALVTLSLVFSLTSAWLCEKRIA